MYSLHGIPGRILESFLRCFIAFEHLKGVFITNRVPTAIKVKPAAEPSDLYEFYHSSVCISEFDDEEEIVPERKRRQIRRRDEDTKMTETNPSESAEELQTIDVSSQLFLSSKRT